MHGAESGRTLSTLWTGYCPGDSPPERKKPHTLRCGAKNLRRLSSSGIDEIRFRLTNKIAIMTDSQEVILQAFERPQWYVTSQAFNIKIRVETIKEFTRNLKPENILDIGCGDGSLSLPLLTESNHITFLDRSKSMLDLVSSRIPGGWASRISLLNMDFMDAQFGEQKFDLIICVGVMAYIADRRSFVRKTASLLRSGGTMIIECSDGAHFYTKVNRLYEAIRVKLGGADFPTTARPASELTALLKEFAFEQHGVFRYSLPPYALRRFLTQGVSYHLIRFLFGAAGRNRAARWGNECLFHFKLKAQADEAVSPSAQSDVSIPLART
jgi:ubiquinone/menaquinone biosynthesis C-methylase UbiE